MHLHKILNGAIIFAVIIPFSVPAAEWSAEPIISMRTGYNDNINLTTANHSSVWETVVKPKVIFGVAEEHQGLFGDAGFAIRRFTGGDGRESSNLLDREDYHLNTNAYHNTLLDSFKANLGYIQDTTQDSELEAGIVTDERATRKNVTLGPSWTRTLNELTRLELSYQFTNIRYTDDPGIADLVDYDYHSLSTTLTRQLSPRTQGIFSAGYGSYRPDTNFNSDTLSLQAGLSRNFSETLAATFLVGQRTTTSDRFIGSGFCIGADPGASFPSCTGGIAIPTGARKGEIETTGAVYTASITKTLETGSLSANVSRSSRPGSNGELLDSIRLILACDYRLSEQLRSSLKIRYTENETIVNRVGFVPNQEKETFFQILPKVSWRWRREWELAGEYRYDRSDRVNTTEATRNAFYVTLAYRPPKRSVSR